MRTIKAMLAQRARTARGEEPGAASVCVRTPDSGWACGCLSEEQSAEELSLDQELDVIEELAREGVISLRLAEGNEERRLALDRKEDNVMSNIEREFEASLKSNGHYQNALAEAKSDEDKARVAKYRSNLRATFVSTRQHEEQRKAREERQAALRTEAEGRLASEQHEAAVVAEMQRIQSGVAA